MLPSLDSLRCFCEAARNLNFRRAATAVSLTPTALGQRIRQLEDQLGQKLFLRTSRQVVLTEAGRLFLPHAQEVLASAEACMNLGEGLRPPPASSLVLGTRHDLGMSWIYPLRRALEATRGGLTLHLYFGSGPDLLARVRTREIDLAVGSMRTGDPVLESLRLHVEEYVFTGAPALLAEAPFQRAEHAQRHVLIDTAAETPLFNYWRDAPEGGDRLHFRSVLRMGSIAAVRASVLAGEGLAVLPRYFVQQDLDEKRLAEVLPRVKPLNDFFRLTFRADDPRRTLFESLAQVLRKEPLR